MRHLSVEKRARQNIKRNRRNRTVKSAMRGTLKELAASKDPESTAKLTVKAQKVFDRAAARNVIHKNKAARLKSQIMKKAGAEKAE